MGKAARAIIIENGNLLVMKRMKYGAEYYTLVGGRLNEQENATDALVREVMEETGLRVVSARLVFYEEHKAPHNEQYVYLCEIAPHSDIALQETSEEAGMNKYDLNVHRPEWVNLRSFSQLQFRTPQLHAAIMHALQNGFPEQAIKLA